MTVLTVSLNLALDVTYRVDRLRPGAMHRVAEPAVRAGGKGVNVSRVLRSLGEETLVLGFAGGENGRVAQDDLAGAGVPAELTRVSGQTRRTIALVDDSGEATLLNEPGPRITDTEWQRFLQTYRAHSAEAAVIVLSGSLPPGLPTDTYATLISEARGTPVILDADGPALLAGVKARPALIKPNAEELRAATGLSDVHSGAQHLLGMGAQAVAVSQGPDGMAVHTASGTWHAKPPEPVTGNPTGAGDAAVAAFARGLGSVPWPDLLLDAVALSAAAVAAPQAGDVDHALYARLL